MRRRRFDDDFLNNMNDGRRYRGMGIFSLIPAFIGMAMLFVGVAFKIVESVSNIFFGALLGSKKAIRENRNHEMNPPRPEPSRQQYSAPKEENPRVINLEEERVKQANRNQKPQFTDNKSHKHNWGVAIFLFTLITSITVLCTGQYLLAGGIFGGGLALVGLYSLLAGLSNRKPKVKPVIQEVCSDEEVEKVLKATEDKIKSIRTLKVKVLKADMQSKIELLCISADKIIKTVRTTPDDMKLVRKFFYYYIDALGEITEKYIKITNSGVTDKEIYELMLDTEKSFDDFNEIFTDYEKKLLEKDLMNLKAEIYVIKNES